MGVWGLEFGSTGGSKSQKFGTIKKKMYHIKEKSTNSRIFIGKEISTMMKGKMSVSGRDRVSNVGGLSGPAEGRGHQEEGVGKSDHV